ncbi:MAG: SUMF1/EgtB/PvdO family nonheme iron enzyme [Candidatus Eisenbacteria bacterium]|nr:SUMF1/EgtB/PvdO family nonheme iron enzyme [Candidatus Eisenbacteria bacterium]
MGAFRANGFGLHDTHGNLWEWCHDVYRPYFSNPSAHPFAGRAEKEDWSSPHRVLRGGSWNADHLLGRSASRFSIEPGYNVDNGFRPSLAANPID